MSNATGERMIEINERQKHYYEVSDGSTINDANTFATNLWRRLRIEFYDRVRSANLRESIISTQRSWLGDVSDAKVIDVGVGEGNPLSLDLAGEAKEYLAIDLSESRIARFRERLEASDAPNAKAMAVDFLHSSFDESDFDVAYAVSVVHHFEDLGFFLDVLLDKLRPGGIVVTQDPLETWLPVKLARAAYRPFQQDADWEWPFNQESLDAIESRFEILEIRGIYGRSKWAVPLSLLSRKKATSLAQKWHADDFKNASSLDSVQHCLQVTMKLQKRHTS